MRRELGLFSVFSIVAGAMISSGLFVLPGIIYRIAGPSIILSYILAGILILPTLFSKAELATAMPKAGGTYFFVGRSMGACAGVISGLSNCFATILKSAFALIGIGAFLQLINPQVSEPQIKLLSIILCVIFVIANLISIKVSGRLQAFLVIFLLTVLFLFFILGIEKISLFHFHPFFSKGKLNMLKATGIVFISYIGLTKVAAVAEEVKNPGKNLPYGMLLALIVVSLLYAGCVSVTIGLLSPDEISQSLSPLCLASTHIYGRITFIIMAIAAICAFVTTANAGIMTASRTLIAMSKDKLLPEKIKINSAVIITGIFMIAMILFLKIEQLVKVASTLQIILFIMVNISLIIMRESKLSAYRPQFKSPLYPWGQIAGVIIYTFLLFEMGKFPLITSGIFILACVSWYYFYARSRVQHQSVLMHVLSQLTGADKELIKGNLEEELIQILRERDEVKEDRFDRLIRKCEILDLHEKMNLEEFLHFISQKLSQKLGISEDYLFNEFLKRERECSTCIHPGLAIPHIVLPGEGKFEMMVIRSKEGVKFTEEFPPAHIIFVLCGTMDERDFYLRALMAIAQTVQEKGFEEKWMKAETTEDIRRLILLSQRRRL